MVFDVIFDEKLESEVRIVLLLLNCLLSAAKQQNIKNDKKPKKRVSPFTARWTFSMIKTWVVDGKRRWARSFPRV